MLSHDTIDKRLPLYLFSLCLLWYTRYRHLHRRQDHLHAEWPTDYPVSFFFPKLHLFRHRQLFQRHHVMMDILNSLKSYIEEWIQPVASTLGVLRRGESPSKTKIIGNGKARTNCDPSDLTSDSIILPEKEDLTYQLIIFGNARIQGGILDVSKGSIYIGENVHIEPGTFIAGPAIIGNECHIRHGAYIRGGVILGDHVVLRAEIKNSIVMDYGQLSHPGYCGDSICGYKSHFGNQVTTANLPLARVPTSIKIRFERNQVYDTRRSKLGVILGDYSQLGCSSVTDPGTFIGANTFVYPLTRLPKGIYPSNSIIKNKPMEHGIITCIPQQPVEPMT